MGQAAGKAAHTKSECNGRLPSDAGILLSHIDVNQSAMQWPPYNTRTFQRVNCQPDALIRRE